MNFMTLVRQLMGWLGNSKMLQTPNSTKTTTPAKTTVAKTTVAKTKTINDDLHDGKWEVARI